MAKQERTTRESGKVDSNKKCIGNFVELGGTLYSHLYTRETIVCLLVAAIKCGLRTGLFKARSYHCLLLSTGSLLNGTCLKNCCPITTVGQKKNKCLKSTSASKLAPETPTNSLITSFLLIQDEYFKRGPVDTIPQHVLARAFHNFWCRLHTCLKAVGTGFVAILRGSVACREVVFQGLINERRSRVQLVRDAILLARVAGVCGISSCSTYVRKPVWNLPRKLGRVQLPNLVRNLAVLGGKRHDGRPTSPYTGRYGGPLHKLLLNLVSCIIALKADLICTVQDHDGNTTRHARRSDEPLGVHVSLARIVPWLLGLGRVSEEIRVAFNIEVLRADEGEARRVWSSTGMKGLEKTDDPRENPPTSGIVRHDSHMRKSGSNPAGNRCKEWGVRCCQDVYVAGQSEFPAKWKGTALIHWGTLNKLPAHNSIGQFREEIDFHTRTIPLPYTNYTNSNSVADIGKASWNQRRPRFRIPDMLWVQSRVASLRIFASGNSAGRCHWLAGFLGDFPFSLPLHYGAAPSSSHFTLIGFQDLAVKSNPNLSTHSLSCTGERERERERESLKKRAVWSHTHVSPAYERQVGKDKKWLIPIGASCTIYVGETCLSQPA
ncbi:hypothetical protein PR048_024880 [Dryococelus australis]|uniref:Uncharacterized protein n=1 Tax=Dryococelus australis TaxID=614101 RepID=A0ABQ9GPS6_9NEOP|nr:hypothetical protein PR048_024880 [Dryococelus australis]